MDFMDVVRKRRSIRKYKPDLVPERVILDIMEAARLAPSGINIQPCHFIVVRDQKTKSQLHVPEWAAEAPVLIVGCSDAEESPRWYILDMGIAFEHIVLAATNFGLATCWIGWSEYDERTKKVLGIPDRMKVVAVTPLGYPAETPEPKTRKRLSDIVHLDKFISAQ